MLFWIIVSLVTAATAVFILLPLLRRSGPPEGERSHDVEVYRDQLKEVERDQAQGLISVEEAGYAKAEIGRRLIATAEKAGADEAPPRRARHPGAAIFVIALLPVVASGLYIFHIDAPGVGEKIVKWFGVMRPLDVQSY